MMWTTVVSKAFTEEVPTIPPTAKGLEGDTAFALIFMV